MFGLGRWHPHDGYGVRCEVDLPNADEFADKRSTSFVLHLHGSLCVRTSEFEKRREQGLDVLVQRTNPHYTFDPYTISANFGSFQRKPAGDDVESLVIAPVPDKSFGLKRPFVLETYKKAVELVRESDTIVVIGYSFNDHDRPSYQPLLEALRESDNVRLVLVSPDTSEVAEKVCRSFPNLSIEQREGTFKQWVAASFPGISSRR